MWKGSWKTNECHSSDLLTYSCWGDNFPKGHIYPTPKVTRIAQVNLLLMLYFFISKYVFAQLDQVSAQIPECGVSTKDHNFPILFLSCPESI